MFLPIQKLNLKLNLFQNIAFNFVCYIYLMKFLLKKMLKSEKLEFWTARQRFNQAMPNFLTINKIESRIFTIRGLQVMLDSDIAAIYQVEVKRLNEQVRRNIGRFPKEFRFQLTELEFKDLILRSQIATSSMLWKAKRLFQNAECFLTGKFLMLMFWRTEL
jgi:hypothetical protein